MRIPFEYIGALQQENKILKKEVADFKSEFSFFSILFSCCKAPIYSKGILIIISPVSWWFCSDSQQSAPEDIFALFELRLFLKVSDFPFRTSCIMLLVSLGVVRFYRKYDSCSPLVSWDNYSRNVRFMRSCSNTD